MTQMYYEKSVTARWYDERLKETLEVRAWTYEMLQEPNREKALTMALRSCYQSAGDFEYNDEYKEEFVESMPIYPDVDIGTLFRIGVIDKSLR